MWSTSDRRERLPDNWEAIRRQVKTRAKGKCQATTHAKGCGGWGSDADHIEAGDNHHLDNLQWLSRACHWAKTNREAAARNTARAAARYRPSEQHPGRLT
jgi:5-methylcytosine-specific restriction protein A